jgi:hypothetical protein
VIGLGPDTLVALGFFLVLLRPEAGALGSTRAAYIDTDALDMMPVSRNTAAALTGSTLCGH